MTDYEDLFTVETDSAEALVHIVTKGFFTTESYAQYKLEVTNAVLSVQKGNRTVRVLSDLRQCSVQSQEIALDNAWMYALEKYMKKTATVLNSTIHKMQLQRSINGDTLRFFDTIEAAQEWLAEKD